MDSISSNYFITIKTKKMDIKVRTLFLGVLLIASLGLKAQELNGGEYEYAEVYFTASAPASYDLVISITYSDRESEIVQTGLKSSTGRVFITEVNDVVLKEVNKRIKDGWQVMNATLNSVNNPVYFLRRKKQ